MAYYNVCPLCGCNLDPGERCECKEMAAKEQENRKVFYNNWLVTEGMSGQMTFAFEHPGGGAIGA